MKTRVIHTKFFKDRYVFGLNDYEYRAFTYLLFNENVNMIGTYELNDEEIKLWSKLTEQQLVKVKEKFSLDKKILFKDGWVYLVNHNKYNSYGNGRQQPAFEREQKAVPKRILDYFDTSINTSIDTSMHTRPNTENINHKSKIIIPKSKTLNPNVERVNLFLNKFNEVYQTKYISVKSFIKNFEYWNKEYTIEQICEAVEKSKLSDFWADKLTPEKMLRTNADRIGEFLNIKTQPIPPYSEIGGDEWIDDNADVYKVYKGKKVYANPAQPTSSQEQ